MLLGSQRDSFLHPSGRLRVELSTLVLLRVLFDSTFWRYTILLVVDARLKRCVNPLGLSNRLRVDALRKATAQFVRSKSQRLAREADSETGMGKFWWCSGDAMTVQMAARHGSSNTTITTQSAERSSAEQSRAKQSNRNKNLEEGLCAIQVWQS